MVCEPLVMPSQVGAAVVVVVGSVVVGTAEVVVVGAGVVGAAVVDAVDVLVVAWGLAAF